MPDADRHRHAGARPRIIHRLPAGGLLVIQDGVRRVFFRIGVLDFLSQLFAEFGAQIGFGAVYAPGGVLTP